MITEKTFDKKVKLKEILRCPECKGTLMPSYKEEGFQCRIHGRFKTIGGIPSFTQGHKFDKHWEDNFSKEIPSTKLKVARDFLRPLFEYKKSHGPSTILDAGCGDGVHVEAFCGKDDIVEGDLVVALDASMQALGIAKQRSRNNVEYIHGDISRLPFEDDSFDLTFSFGVLAYTDNPSESFAELCRVTKEGGLIGIWIYPKPSGLLGRLFLLTRKICRFVGPIGTRVIADFIIPFLGMLPTFSKINLSNASWRQCREIVLVNIAPRQLFFPTHLEVEKWLLKNNIKVIQEDEDAPITVWGKKC